MLMPPPPGFPEFCVICAPAIFPCSAWSTVTALDFATALLSTDAMLVPTARRSVGAAVPVTRTSDSVVDAVASAKSAVTVCPAATVTERR
jgi:hypothetical protein